VITRLGWGLAVLILTVSDPLAQPPGSESVESLFQEAQRYHLGLDRPRDVREAYRRYIDIVKRQPDHAGAYYNLAGICFEQKRYDLASGYYHKVIGIRPDDADAINNLGVVSDRQGKEERAAAYYRKAIQVDPDLAQAHYNLAQSFLRDGHLDKALREAEAAVRLSPDTPSFVSLRARILGEMGKLSEVTMLVVAGGFVAVVAGCGLWYRRGAKQ